VPLTLEDAIESPDICPAFRRFCQLEHEEENLDFILLVRDMTKLGPIGFNPGFPAGTAANDQANYIYHHFINPPGSDKAVFELKDAQSAQVNVGGHILKFLAEKVAQKKLEPDSFLEEVQNPRAAEKFSAYVEIWKLVELNAWLRFQESPAGKEILKKEEARIKAPKKHFFGWGWQKLPQPFSSTPASLPEKKSDKKT